MKNRIESQSPSTTDEFSALAKKIRMEKIDRKEIQKLKLETIMNERQKHRRMKCIIKLQSAFRGYKFRKQFQVVIDDLNTRTIIEYLYDKHKNRIHKNATAIISHHLDVYIKRKQSQKEKYLNAYFNYCADVIKSTYLSFKIRKKLKPIRDLLKSKKAIISRNIAAFKTRLILRSSSIQNILVEIANIKYCLNNIKKEDQLRNDFTSRLPKLFISFYNMFYSMKNSSTWVDAPKSETDWLWKYMSLIYKDNPKYKSLSKVMGNKTKSIKNFIGVNNSQNLQEDYDSKPIKPMSGTFNEIVDTISDNRQSVKKKNENPYEDYENKVIKVKKIDYEHMFDDGNPLPDVNTDNQGSSSKKKPIKKSVPKKPRYDARKAIEEAKQREAQNGAKKEVKSSFRDFIREMKNNAKSSSAVDSNVVSSPPNEETKTQEEPRRNRRQEPREISMRRKLHELERSPPPKLNIHNVKSKIECWGGDIKSNYNSANIKKVKKEEENFTLGKIEKIYSKICYSVSSAMKAKEETMRAQYKKIPYIKNESLTIENFTTENYNAIVSEILSKYDEMKNQN